MIGRLKGVVVQESIDGVVLDVNGVGYELAVPIGTLGRAMRDASGNVTLQVHTHVREDAITLFGFADDTERAMFRMLTAVNGVGPKIAIGILGTLPPNELAATVARGDAKRLQAVPGVGRKIAERLLLELKDKIAAGVVHGSATRASVPQSTAANSGGSRANGPLSAVAIALTRLGFKPAEADRAALSLTGREAEPLDALVRDALKVLTQ